MLEKVQGRTMDNECWSHWYTVSLTGPHLTDNFIMLQKNYYISLILKVSTFLIGLSVRLVVFGEPIK